MFSSLCGITTALLGLSLLSCASSITPGFPYGTEKVRGVNLGGWLVLEPFITPSLFDKPNNAKIVDEWTFCQYQSTSTAKAALKAHWDTWITEADFANISAAGLNHVRIPIGYWAFGVGPGEHYISGQLPYLQKAVTWAGKYGLKVLVDLHGAPGSQNGFDNSGQRMTTPHWHSNSTNVQRTNTIIKTIASMFKDNTNVVPIIAPLNEPAGFDSGVLPVVKQYWLDSYGNVRYPYGTSQQGNAVLLIGDAFQSLPSWKGFLATSGGYEGVAMDTHIYQVFDTTMLSYSYQQHIDKACTYGAELSSFDLWIIVGEWSVAHTDCAKDLLGRGRGSKYAGTYHGSTKIGSCTGLTGSASSFSKSFKTFLRQYFEAQTSTFEQGQGWIQWTWKTETTDEWSYSAGLLHGWIPKNPTTREYPNICSSTPSAANAIAARHHSHKAHRSHKIF